MGALIDVTNARRSQTDDGREDDGRHVDGEQRQRPHCEVIMADRQCQTARGRGLVELICTLG